MTTCSYTITLNDSESIMMKDALNLMIQHCEERIIKGEGSPYWVHKQSAEAVLRRLYSDTHKTSGNNFFG